MRLFTGISIPPQAVERLLQVQAGAGLPSTLKWQPAENLHITTKFIGEWPEARLVELNQALGSLEAQPAPRISIRGIGLFPDSRHARYFAARIEPNAELAALARNIDHVLGTIGIPVERRAYSPHITLARIRDNQAAGPRTKTAYMTDIDFGTFNPGEFHLYLSTPTARHSVYSILKSYPLRGAAK